MERLSGKVHKVNYLVLLIVPLILGIVLYVGTYLVVKNQIDSAGDYKARHFKTEMEQMFQEISIISASIVSDSSVARMLLEDEFDPEVRIVGNLEKASWEFLYQALIYQQLDGIFSLYHPVNQKLLERRNNPQSAVPVLLM